MPQSAIAADNAQHSIYRDDLVSQTTNALTWARDQINTTDVDASFASSLSTATDVHVEDAAYTTYCGYGWVTATAPGTAALTTCNRLNVDNECEQHAVRISRIVSESETTTHVRNMVTHEMGHSLGLGHQGDANDLMWGGGINNTTTFNQHEKDLVNDYY